MLSKIIDVITYNLFTPECLGWSMFGMMILTICSLIGMAIVLYTIIETSDDNLVLSMIAFGVIFLLFTVGSLMVPTLTIGLLLIPFSIKSFRNIMFY